MDYVREIHRIFKAHQSQFEQKDVHIALIGCGKPALGKKMYDRWIGSEPLIAMYSDNTQKSYAAMGTIHGNTQFSCKRCVSGCCVTLYLGITRCWCFCSSGDIAQQGAQFVMKTTTATSSTQENNMNKSQCVFRHIEKYPGQ